MENEAATSPLENKQQPVSLFNEVNEDGSSVPTLENNIGNVIHLNENTTPIIQDEEGVYVTNAIHYNQDSVSKFLH